MTRNLRDVSHIGTAFVMMRRYWSIVRPSVNGCGRKCPCVNSQVTEMATVTVKGQPVANIRNQNDKQMKDLYKMFAPAGVTTILDGA